MVNQQLFYPRQRLLGDFGVCSVTSEGISTFMRAYVCLGGLCLKRVNI